jgi:hypothetical protein
MTLMSLLFTKIEWASSIDNFGMRIFIIVIKKIIKKLNFFIKNNSLIE